MSPILILAAVISVALASPEYLSQWNEFKAVHNKNYNSKQEEQQRLEVFIDNLNQIKEHNKLYEAGLETYEMGVTKFADMTHEEFMNYLSLSGAQPKLGGNVFVPPAGVKAPESIDYREKNAVNPIKDQGSCGSCWAFSTTGSLESINFLQKGKLLSLSEQNLVDCSQSYGNYGCNGGLMNSAFNYIRDKGIESEEEYPYKAWDGNCQYNASEVVVKITGYVDIKTGSESDLQAAVGTVGPVSVAVDASKFQLYKGGIFSTPGPYYLNHGVVAIGYGKEGTQEYWLVRNSWGPSWGEDGYIRIARNQNNQVGITDNASYPTL